MTRQIPNIPTQEKIALRINETVAVSGLSRSTIYELLKAGKLRAVKIGGRRLILREDLQALLEVNANRPA
jgi:excisionase family DNA binding protein